MRVHHGVSIGSFNVLTPGFSGYEILVMYFLLNIGYVSNETNADVRMYIEEFILVAIWIHCCTSWT